MSAFPEDFVRQMEDTLGSGAAARLIEALQEPSPVSIRYNDGSHRHFADGGKVAWCASGRYLQPPRPAFTFDPLFHAGDYYVQEASSMFIEQAYRRITAEEQPRRVLDLCAAPGGKSTLWRSLLPEQSLLVANEPLRPRAAVLAENMQKWGHPDVVVTSAWPAAFQALPAYFDVIAADVPCSGEGMFRKDAGAVGEWSLQNVAQCAARQRDIIRDVWPALRPGGFLVYSTCTFNRQEDEENVRFICQELGAEPVRIDVPEEWGIEGDTAGTDLPVYHFFPHRALGEGFFLALLRKTADEPLHQLRKVRPDKQLSVPRNAPFRQWLREPEAWTFMYTDEGRVSAVHSWWKDDACRLRQNIRTLLCGVEVAEEKGRKVIPAHALALSRAAAGDVFAQTELDYAAALAYLRHESLVLEGSVPRGYVRVAYEGRPLGFVNQLGARANNLYPAQWRIRSSYVPASFEAAVAAYDDADYA